MKGGSECNLFRSHSLSFSTITQRSRCLVSLATEVETLSSLPAGSYGFPINMERKGLLLRVKKIDEWSGCRNFFRKFPYWWFVSRSSPLKIYSLISYCCHKPLKDWNLLFFLSKKSCARPHLIFHFKWHSHWKPRRSANSLRRCAKKYFFLKLNSSVMVQKGLKLPCKSPPLLQKMMTRD